jgi:ribonucleoside-diphosphate reductase alpha chain
MKIVKIKRNADICHTFDVTTRTGAFALPNGCVSHNSSVVVNSTNGIALPAALISIKESKGSLLPHVVPEYVKLKNKYQLLWEQKDCLGYLKTAAVLAAYTDQSISTDTFYSSDNYPNGKIPSDVIASHLMLGTHWGLKTFYYSLLNKQAAMKYATTEVAPQETTVVEEDEDSDCEACKL